jgi:hypothetical protein
VPSESSGTWGRLGGDREAVGEHYAGLREPAFKPELQEQPFRDRSWTTEKRVPPFNPTWDFLRIGDRYDIFKEFELGGRVFGVAMEMERWESIRTCLNSGAGSSGA